MFLTRQRRRSHHRLKSTMSFKLQAEVTAVSDNERPLIAIRTMALGSRSLERCSACPACKDRTQRDGLSA
jgi:hypothetical protein